MLLQLQGNIIANCRWKPTKVVLFHRDNKAVIAMTTVYHFRFELLDHPPYFRSGTIGFQSVPKPEKRLAGAS